MSTQPFTRDEACAWAKNAIAAQSHGQHIPKMRASLMARIRAADRHVTGTREALERLEAEASDLRARLAALPVCPL